MNFKAYLINLDPQAVKIAKELAKEKERSFSYIVRKLIELYNDGILDIE